VFDAVTSGRNEGRPVSIAFLERQRFWE